MERHSLKFRRLTTAVEVSSDSKRVIDDLEELLGRFHPAGGPVKGPFDASFFVGAGEPAGGFSLVCNGKPVVETHSYAYLLALLEYEICAAVVRSERRHLLVHAAAAARGRSGCLFPGRAGSGKTTLTASLIAHDFVCFSDDTAAVDLKTLDLAAFAWPLRIKPGAGGLPAPEDGRLRPGWYGPDPGTYPFRYLVPGEEWIGREPLPVHLLIFPLYRPGVKTGMTGMSGAQAAMELARHSFNLLGLGEPGFDCLTEVARRARAFFLVYSDVNEAIEKILTLCVRARR